MEITTALVKEVRELSGAGVLDCRKTLEACDGDKDAALSYLREKGLSAAAKRADREASEGLIEVYLHQGSRVGVMLELNCESDFVARTEDFQTLAHDLALHVAFADPACMTREDVPEQVLEAEKEVYRNQALEEGKPENIVDRIIEGRLEKFYQEICLMDQPFVKDEDSTISQLITDAIARLGENIILRRFVRYELGASAE